MMMQVGIVESVLKVISGIKSVGDGVTQIIVWFFSLFGLQIPYQLVQILMIAIIIFTIIKIGSTVSKVVLAILIFLLIACSLSLSSILPIPIPIG